MLILSYICFYVASKKKKLWLWRRRQWNCGAKNTSEFLWESSCWALSHECDPVRHNCAIFPLSFHSRDCSHGEDDTVTFVSTFAAGGGVLSSALSLICLWCDLVTSNERATMTTTIESVRLFTYIQTEKLLVDFCRPERRRSRLFWYFFLHSNGRHSATQQECFWMKFFSFGWWS